MRYVVFDIETANTFSEAGSANPADLTLALVAAYNSETQAYTSYVMEDLHTLWPLLESADALVGYNSDHFDIPLLDKYYPGDLTRIKSIDLLKTIRESLGRRLKLDSVAQATLGAKKSADGLQSIQWWRQGEIEKVREYCIQDVKVTKELFEYMRDNKKICYTNGPKIEEVVVDVSDWSEGETEALTHTLPF
jgi:DEAD/DEAH box helicase domain-containing protein